MCRKKKKKTIRHISHLSRCVRIRVQFGDTQWGHIGDTSKLMEGNENVQYYQLRDMTVTAVVTRFFIMELNAR